MAGHPDGLLGLLLANYGLEELEELECVLVSVLELELGEVELEVELLVLVVRTLLPLLVPVWSLAPPSFLLHPAKAMVAQKMRIDFFIN
jgi:hypothetical protein